MSMSTFTLVASMLAMGKLALSAPHSGQAATEYRTYTGNGANWPAESAWQPFESMFDANKALISISCSQFSQANPSEAEMNEMKTAINKVSGETGVSAQLILAIIMQESKGCPRVWTTTSPDGRVRNPGLMQDHDGAGTCNANAAGQSGQPVNTPCPLDDLEQMIRDGAGGTRAGDGLKQTLNKAGQGPGGNAQPYRAARMYNSGSIAPSGDLGDGLGATNCYASDVANRLMGWVGNGGTPCSM